MSTLEGVAACLDEDMENLNTGKRGRVYELRQTSREAEVYAREVPVDDIKGKPARLREQMYLSLTNVGRYMYSAKEVHVDRKG